MEELFNDNPRNPVPYRATRTLPNFPQNNERRFEPSWTRNTSNSRMFNSNRFPIPCLSSNSPVSYTRDNIFKIINSIGGPPSPPPQDLQACPQIFSMDTTVALKLLDKSYYTPDPKDCDHIPSSYFLLSTSQPKTFESRGLSGRGRGRGMDFGGGWTNRFESNSKWSRCPVFRKFSSESTDIPSTYPRQRVVSECSHSESVSEGLSESPLETAPDWQYFPGDETCGDKEYNSSQNSIEPEQEDEIPFRSNFQNNTFDDKMVSWPDPNPHKFNRGADMLENSKVDYPNSTQQKERESHSFSFLNPSHVETPDPIPNANKSDFFCSSNSDNKFKRTQMLRSSHSDVDILNQSSSNIIPDPQDLRHLWYYVDPKGNIQGPFHSDLMDSWYGRKFFPTTLPIWRECDTQSFKLVNLLNITDNSEQPFFRGAELVLISKEFSLVEIPNIKEVPIALPETLLDNRLETRDEKSTRKTPGISLETEIIDEAEKCDPFTLSREKAIQQSKIDTTEGYSTDSSPHEHSEILTISLPPEEVFQHIPLESSQEITNKLGSPEPKFTPISITEQNKTQPSKANMWLSGPPKIPEQLTKGPTQVPPVVDTAQVQTSLPPSNTTVKTSKEQTPVYRLPSSEELRRPSEDKRRVKSKSTSSIIDPQQDKSGWTKVGLEKKQKAKAKKVSLSASNQTVSQAIPTPEESGQKNQPSTKAKHSSNRSKLDELDSFCLRRQTFSLLPPPHNGIPVVKFDAILTEQSRAEQCREDEEFIVQSKRPTWASSPTETVTASFLDIEKEQKETAREDAARAEGIRIKEAQVADQPVVLSTWSRVTKKDKLNADTFTADVCEVSNSEVTQTIDTVLCVPIIMETDRAIQIPVINSESEVFVKPRNTATKVLPSEIVPDGILLSPACYEWTLKEILSLNEWMDPPTVITALQDFNGLFEITQLGSEMFGTSERTNALCKRIYEDLAKVKKYKYKTTQLQSADDEWVKISKKSNKSTKKKGKPSKSSED